MAGYRTGLCDFDHNRKCCEECDKTCLKTEKMEKKNDTLCAIVNGECVHETNYCEGYYSSGKCGGSEMRQGTVRHFSFRIELNRDILK